MRKCEKCATTNHVRVIQRMKEGLYFICESCIPSIFNEGRFRLMDYPSGELIDYNAKENWEWYRQCNV